MTDNKKKLNEGCLKVFNFLQLLYEEEADYSKVIEIFKDSQEVQTNKAQVTLSKYINTLKVFGMKIQKEKNRYKINNSVYSLKLEESDIKALSILANSIKSFPQNKMTQEVENFIRKIELRMDNKDKNTLRSMCSNSPYDFEFYYSDLREQILMCEKLCTEGHYIDILYTYKGQEQKRKCIPKEVIYDSKNVYLKLYDIKEHSTHDVSINTILSIAVSPSVAKNTEACTTVVFKLKNRLAKSYKLKENERSEGYNENGELIVINKNESFDKLLPRLMRYTYDCEILSPKNLRLEMEKLIAKTLENYTEEN